MKNRGDILLQKWIDGSITYAEEQELERLAQADPFLADAWAGLRQMPASDHAAHIVGLKGHLRKRTEEKRRGLVFYLPRIAAAAAVMMGLFFGLRYFVWNEKNVPDVAMTQEQVESTPKLPDTPISEDAIPPRLPKVTPELPASIPKLAKPQKTPPQLPAIARVEPEVMEEKERERGLPLNNYDAEILMREDPKTQIASAPPPPPSPPPMPEKKLDTTRDFARSGAVRSQDANDINRLQATISSPRTIIGTITDEQGLPLIGASVLVKGTSQGTVTDIDGNFQLAVPLGHKALIINYTGFLNKEIELGQSDSIAVQVNAGQMALDEVVVTGFSQQKARHRAAREQEKLDKLPEPRKGFEKLERYISKNLQYPDAAKAQGIEGVVEVEFLVLPDGTLSNFVIQKSLGYGCDAEAIRLLREGPKWRLYSLQNNRMVYTIFFELK